MVVKVHNVDIFVTDGVSLMPVTLMSIQIYHHYSLLIPSSSHIMDDHCDIWIYAEPSALRAACVMESP